MAIAGRCDASLHARSLAHTLLYFMRHTRASSKFAIESFYGAARRIRVLHFKAKPTSDGSPEVVTITQVRQHHHSFSAVTNANTTKATFRSTAEVSPITFQS